MKSIVAIAAVAILALTLAGCNSNTTTIEPVIGGDGKPVVDAAGNIVNRTIVETHESPMAHKNFSAAGSCAAVKLDTAGSASTGTVFPTGIVGGGTASVSSTSPMGKDEDNPPTFLNWWMWSWPMSQPFAISK